MSCVFIKLIYYKYAQSGKSACTIHNIGETALHEIVAEQIRTHAQLVTCNEKRIVDEILRQQNTEAINSQKTYQNEIKAHQKRISKLNVFIEKLYEDRVNGIVPEDFFRRQLEKYEDEKCIVDEILRQQNIEVINSQKTYQNEIKAHQKRISKLNVFIEKLYEDRVNGIVPEDFFRRQLEKYEQERVDRLQTATTLERKLSEIKLRTDKAGTWARLIKQYTQIETLDSETLLLLVDKIIVGEAKKVDGKRICDVRISYNYVGNLDGIGGADYE